MPQQDVHCGNDLQDREDIGTQPCLLAMSVSGKQQVATVKRLPATLLSTWRRGSPRAQLSEDMVAIHFKPAERARRKRLGQEVTPMSRHLEFNWPYSNFPSKGQTVSQEKDAEGLTGMRRPGC